MGIYRAWGQSLISHNVFSPFPLPPSLPSPPFCPLALLRIEPRPSHIPGKLGEHITTELGPGQMFSLNVILKGLISESSPPLSYLLTFSNTGTTQRASALFLHW